MLPRRKIHVLPDEGRLVLDGVLHPRAYGPDRVAAFEKAFAAYVGAKHAFAVSSGRAGMGMLFRSLGLKPGDEVVVPAYTLKALLSLVRGLGLVPVVADVEPDTFNVSERTVLAVLTARTRVIMPAHLFGSPARLDGIMALARGRGIKVVEDCAHSAGASIDGRQTGSLADAAFFSFETIKPINTYGGGMVVTSDAAIAESFRAVCAQSVSAAAAAGNGGVPAKKIVSAMLERVLLPTPVAFPPLYLLASPRWRERVFSLYRSSQNSVIQQFAYTGFQAALGLGKLGRLDAWVEARNRNAALLKSLLPGWLVPQADASGARPNRYFFVARVAEGAGDVCEIRRRLLCKGIDAGIGAEIADDCSDCGGVAACPSIGRVFGRAIHLPLNERMSERDVRRVARAVEAVGR